MSKDASELNSSNIITPTLDELTEEYRRKYEQRLQEFEDDQRRRKKEFEDAMLSCFQKTRQGVVMKEPELPTIMEAPKVGSVSDILHDLKQDMAVLIDQSVSASVCNTRENFMKNLDDKMTGHIKDLCDKMQVSSVLQQSVPHNETGKNKLPLITDASTSNNASGMQSLVSPALFTPITGEPLYGMPMNFYAGQSSSSPITSVPQSATGSGPTHPTFFPSGSAAIANSSATLAANNQSRVDGILTNPLVSHQTMQYYVPPTLPQVTSNIYGSLPTSDLNSSLRNLPSTQPSQAPQRSYNTTHPNPLVQQQPIAQDRPMAAEPHVGTSNNLKEQLASVLKDSFGLEPKGKARAYRKPYPDYFDTF